MTDEDIFNQAWSYRLGSLRREAALERYLSVCRYIDACKPDSQQGVVDYRVLQAMSLIQVHASDLVITYPYAGSVRQYIYSGNHEAAKRMLAQMYSERRRNLVTAFQGSVLAFVVGLAVVTVVLLGLNGG